MENVSKEIQKAANEHAHNVFQQLMTRVNVYQGEKARIINSAVSDFIAGAVWAQNNEKDNKFIKSMKQVPKQVKMNVGVKKLRKDAVIPSYAHETDCGMDLTAVSKTFDEYGNVVYGFGLAFEIPEGYAGFIFPRSSNHKSGLLLTNSVGVIDAGFRGEVTAKFASRTKLSRPANFWEKLKLLFGSNPEGRNMAVTTNEVWNKDINYNIGDRVAQIVILPYPKVEFVEVDELSATERGTGGYGSTGK